MTANHYTLEFCLFFLNSIFFSFLYYSLSFCYTILLAASVSTQQLLSFALHLNEVIFLILSLSIHFLWTSRKRYRIISYGFVVNNLPVSEKMSLSSRLCLHLCSRRNYALNRKILASLSNGRKIAHPVLRKSLTVGKKLSFNNASYFSHFRMFCWNYKASQVVLVVKNLPANAGDLRDMSLIPGLVDPLEKGMATHSSTFAWRIPWTEEPGGLWSIGLHRVGHV